MREKAGLIREQDEEIRKLVQELRVAHSHWQFADVSPSRPPSEPELVLSESPWPPARSAAGHYHYAACVLTPRRRNQNPSQLTRIQLTERRYSDVCHGHADSADSDTYVAVATHDHGLYSFFNRTQ
jgi:hypothetical protein